MSLVDSVLTIVFVISVLLGLWRGFTREFFGIIGWACSIVISYLTYKPLADFLQTWIAHPLVRTVIAVGVVFVVSLIFFTTITFKLSHGVRNSALGFVDRFLGACYGGLRGAVVLVFVVFLTNKAFPENDKPIFVSESKLLPYITNVSSNIKNSIPEQSVEKWKTRVDEVTSSLNEEGN